MPRDFFATAFYSFPFSVLRFRRLHFRARPLPNNTKLNTIIFKIDGTTSKDVYRDLMQTVETPARFWTFLYNSVYRNIGSKPVYFDPVLFEGDIMRLRQYLRDNGYSHGLVDTSLYFDTEEKKGRS